MNIIVACWANDISPPPPLWQTDLICIKDTLKVFSNIFQRERRRSNNDERFKCAWNNRRRYTVLCSTSVASLVTGEIAFIVVDTADARVGRPLTPMSVAGVNRRVIGAHIMVLQPRVQLVRAFTPPTAVQFGTQVLGFVGTDPTLRLKETT